MATRDEDFVSKVFVANTHVPMLFFSTRGMVYKSKVWKMPLGNPQARGKALINLLPLEEGETISTIMPLPEDESSWSQSNVMFATSSGDVRRNELSDFVDVKANGKIAMKLAVGERLIGVAVCNDSNDILLAAKSGKAIRFPVDDVRVFTGRTSTGVRGVRLDGDDTVVSMSVLRHIDVETEERDAYLRYAAQKRRSIGEGEPEEVAENGEAPGETVPESNVALSIERIAQLEVAEEFILTVTAKGYGKRSSSYEYRTAGRGGQGIANIEVSSRNGPVAASFPVEDTDQIMLVTDAGKLIRTSVHDIRIARRQTQGVTIFKVADDEHVVAVAHLPDMAEEGEGNGVEENGTEDGGAGGENGGK
jgi:DNA gyrase subunit A